MTNVVASESKSQYPGNTNCKELVMQVLVNLKFSNGDFKHGFEKIMLCAGVVNCENSTELEVKLPPAPSIPSLYKNWQKKYSDLVGTSERKVLTKSDTENIVRGGFERNPATNVSYFSYEKCQNECSKYAVDLRNQINQWLTEIKSQLETKFELDKSSGILLTINTENIASQIICD
ncbi:MAG: hypothetical protein AAF063_34780, partial [Cyanobacteria bacterium J06643_5]